MRERIIFRIIVYSGLLLFGIILLSITSCSPEKRLARLIHKHPELVKTDTVWRKDTITIPGASKDSAFHFYQHDTVTLKRDNLTVKYYLKSDSTVYIQGKCDPKTIYKAYPVVVNTVTVQPQNWWERNNWWVIIVLIVGVALFVLLKVFK